ncbi:MAG: filamentous hemagglutinin family protein [Pseudomonadales bacterium]|nr:filamentous hemagglutinin family protein [Pseudomonadales bacterium]
MINLQFRRLISCVLIALITWMPVLSYAEVPVPGANFSSDGSSVSTSANGRGGLDMVITQQDADLATYNWDSFNIGRRDAVEYLQPSASSTALNYIHQQNASLINGRLTANGNVILINQNGIMFGDGAVVDVGGLVASSLDIDEQLLRENGFVNSMDEGQPLFKAYYVVDKGRDPEDPSQWIVSVESEAIEIQEGAQLNSDGGRIVIVAPEIINKGEITTPEGQTILVGADQDFDFSNLSDVQIEKIKLIMNGKDPKDFTEDDFETLAEELTEKSGVYFASSTDPDLRGLFVEVGNGGNVHNLGNVIAERGNITALGLSINQEGVMRATTSVNLNGSIRLLARDSVIREEQAATSKDNYFWGVVAADDIEGNADSGSEDTTLELAFKRGRVVYMTPTHTGVVKMASGSTTEVIADRETADDTALRSERQFESIVDVMAADITVEGTTADKSGAVVKATGGIVQMVATRDPGDLAKDENFASDDATLTIESGAVIDVSGSTDAILDMSQNVLAVDVTTNELADSPLQKDGVLNGETIYVDLRGVDDDGIEIVNINDIRGKVRESLAERLSDGGEVRLVSTGDVDFQENAQVDISGGEITYNSGFIRESRLVSASGQVVGVSDASKLDSYVAVLGENERFDPVWGKVESFDSFIAGASGTFVQGYKDGGDAGTFSVVADTFGSSSESGELGTVVSDVVVGPYQYDNAPSGGEFLLNMALSNSGISELLLLGEDEFEEKLGAETNVNEAVHLSSKFLTNSVDHLTVKTSGDVVIGNLTLDGGGELDVSSETSVRVTGALRNPAGDVTLTTKRTSDDPSTDSRNILIDEEAVVDTSGLWINRNPILDQSNRYLNGANLIEGGDITLSALGSTLVAEGSKLIADGGAVLDESGKVTAGKGGDIRLAASNFTEDPNAQLVVDGDLQSFSLTEGGSLSLSSRGFQIGGDPVDADGRIHIDPAFFQQGGFSSFVLTASRKGVEFVGSETPEHIRFETDNYILPTYTKALETLGQPLDQIESGIKLVDVAELADFKYQSQKQRVDLTMNTGSGNSSQINSGVSIGENVIIEMLPGSIFSATSDSNIYQGGQIINHGGDVFLTLVRSSQAFSQAQAIRFGEGSVIDVSATFEELPADGSFWSEVRSFDAGTIDITAHRGYILGAKDSALVADGAVETVFNKTVFNASGNPNLAWEDQALNAGTINLSAAEGILFDGEYSAKAATRNSTGGTLDITMFANNRFEGNSAASGFGSFAEHPMAIVVGNAPDEARTKDLMESTTIADDLAGKNLASGTAYVDIEQLDRSGIDTLALHAINTYGASSGSNLTPTKTANIRFATSDLFTVNHALILDAPEILLGDQSVKIESNYLSIGTSTMSTDNIFSNELAIVGEGTLKATANHMDLSGSSVFPDAALIELNSAGDIRLLGRSNARINPDGSLSDQDFNTTSGRLITHGDLVLSGRQIAPTSLTEFDILLEGEGGTFTTHQVDTPHMLLSAMGTINVSADHIIHGGTLIAPFGQINLGRLNEAGELIDNESIVTLPGSLLSVSGDGLYVPLGEILAGDESWSYTKESASGKNLLETLVDKSITLKGDVVGLADDSTLDVSGGGDIFAFKFTKGIGGSEDVLNSSESFVILPADGNDGLNEWGAYDQVIHEFSEYSTGETIYLDGGAGVPAGEYAILPARYALIPGAYLVTPVGAKGEIAQGISRTREDGAPIIAGRFGLAGIDQQDSQWTPLVIEPGDVAFQRSQYDIFLASEFLAFAENAGRVSLPQDAGGISLQIGSELSLNGNLIATAGKNGLGGYLDIAADRLIVTSSLIDPEIGTVQLLDSQLSELEVESLLLGGTRDRTLNGLSVDVTSDLVEVGEGVELDLPELLVAAKDQLVIKDGASIQAVKGNLGQGGVANLDGDGALLQVSAGGYYNVVRENASGNQGDLIIGDALLHAGHSVTLESTNEQAVTADIKADEALNITAQKLTVAAGSTTDPASNGVTVSQELLANVNAGHQILKSRSELTFLGDVSLESDKITLDAPELIAGSGDSHIEISGSKQLVLRNSSGNSVEVATPGSSTLILESDHIQMQGMDQTSRVTLSGFDQVSLERKSDGIAVINADNNLTVDVGAAALTIQSDAIMGNDGSLIRMATTGDIEYTSLNSIAAVQETYVGGVNSKIILEGNSVDLNGSLLANSGTLQINANHSVNLLDNAFLDVSGLSKTYGSFSPVTRVTHGGVVSLIAENGSVNVADQAVVNLRAGGQEASSGTLEISAREGTASLTGELLLSEGSGRFSAELGSLDNSAEFVSRLLGDETAFYDQFELRLLEGDLAIAEGTQLVSQDITLEASQGSVVIHGQLDASGTNGGSIMLASRDVVQLSGELNASATHLAGVGGTVVLQSKGTEDAGVILEEGSLIDVSSGELIADRGVVEFITEFQGQQSVDAIESRGEIRGSRSINWLVNHSINDNQLTQDDVDSAFNEFAELELVESAMKSVFNELSDSVSVVPQIEVYSDASIDIVELIELRDLRFGANRNPGELLLRSENAINVNHSLMAGTDEMFFSFDFRPTGTYSEGQIVPLEDASWGISLVSGADTQSINQSSVIQSADADIVLAENVTLVTGTGDLSLISGADVVINPDAAIMTIGRTDYVEEFAFPAHDGTGFNLVNYVPDSGTLGNGAVGEMFAFNNNAIGHRRIFYGEDGGDITVVAKGNFAGNEDFGTSWGIDELDTHWRFRYNDDYRFSFGNQETKKVTTWGIYYENFEGVGVLGEGDITVAVDGDVSNIHFAAPTVGVQVGVNPDSAAGIEGVDQVNVKGGGDISLFAGGDINSTSYLVSNGELQLDAGGAIGAVSEDDIALFISYGNADISLEAVDDITLNGTLPEFLTSVSSSQNLTTLTSARNQFNAWVDTDAESALSAQSLDGDISVNLDNRLISDHFTESTLVAQDWKLVSLLPNDVALASLSGDINLLSNSYLLPTDSNGLLLLANNNINVISNGSRIETALNNMNLDDIPTKNNPVADPADFTQERVFDLLSGSGDSLITIQGGQAPSQTEGGEVKVIAATGNIYGSDWLFAPGKESYIEAGQDILSPELRLQNNNDEDVSRVIAGNDILYDITRNAGGILQVADGKGIYLSGAGTLFVQAGGDIQLGASQGIRTNGNLFNSALPDEGADLMVLAGIREQSNIETYLAYTILEEVDFNQEDFAAAGIDEFNVSIPSSLGAFEGLIDPKKLTSDAIRAFINLSHADQSKLSSYLFEQRGLGVAEDIYAYQNFIQHLQAAGVEQANIDAEKIDPIDDVLQGNNRAYTLIDTLFPGSSEQVGVWDGNIDLVFSTLQTQNGGDTYFLTPGGGVNVGLPASIRELEDNPNKQPKDLGVFAKGAISSVYGFSDGNIDVNQSRIFTLDGGDIVLWSSNGNVDAGKGARSAQSVPPPITVFDENGNPETVFPPAISGSGIGTFQTPGRDPGDVYLFAPRGFIDAGEAGIQSAGDLLVLGEVLNADNIDVGGVSVGVPVNAGVSSSVAGIGDVASAATDAVTDSAAGSETAQEAQTPFLTVEIIGLGE